MPRRLYISPIETVSYGGGVSNDPKGIETIDYDFYGGTICSPGNSPNEMYVVFVDAPSAELDAYASVPNVIEAAGVGRVTEALGGLNDWHGVTRSREEWSALFSKD